MSQPRWLRIPRLRRSLALASLVLSVSALYLLRAEAARPSLSLGTTVSGGLVTLTGRGAHGTLRMSQTALAAGSGGTFYAELDLEADRGAGEVERAPLSLAVVLDTSGSMSGAKLDEARRSVRKLLEGMRDDDEVAFVRYADHAEVIQPLARVRDVRAELVARLSQLEATGGTNIPSGLAEGERQLARAGFSRVKRVVLVSDGLDGSRSRAEDLARDTFARGVTVSSLGVGLDFDESYMASLAEIGHGNFGFVKDAGSLARFLDRELVEAATTMVEGTKVRVELPRGVSFLRAVGGVPRVVDGAVEVDVGSISAGDSRRVVLELASSLELGQRASLGGEVSWRTVRGGPVSVGFAGLEVAVTDDLAAVERSRDPGTLASATSAFASLRQLEAASAYARGDVARAGALLDTNERELARAIQAAPAAAAPLLRQVESLRDAKREFGRAPPKSAEGNAAAKAVFERDSANMRKNTF
jgi:Ca-activated chloride channel family protein